jgi:uncharacterized protein (DUF1501 family)
MVRSILPNRREVMMSAAGLIAFAHRPALAERTGRDPRLLVIFLRGGLDGLAAVPPVGDPVLQSARQFSEQTPMPKTLPLDGIFALNAAMPTLHGLHGVKEALFVHAVASPYRARSHFDAQDVMESGLWPGSAARPASGAGWLNRAMQALPVAGKPRSGLAVAPTIPLMMQGKAPIETYQQQRLGYVDEDTVERLHKLYAAQDRVLADALSAGDQLDMITRGDGAAPAAARINGQPNFATDCRTAASLLARPDGPRIGMINLIGWDTHIAEANRLDRQLAALDLAVGAVREGFGAAWGEAAVLIITEFGRTVRFNGTAGADHGNGSVAMLVGGAINGGRTIADWPGLRDADLFEGRDLKPTTDIRSLFKGVMADHFGIGAASMERDIFPDSKMAAPLRDLIRA